MAILLRALDEFITLVNQTAVVDSIPPYLPRIETRDIEISIAVNHDSANLQLFFPRIQKILE